MFCKCSNVVCVKKRIAFVSLKGGTGKTTSCMYVAKALSCMGESVEVVDTDPQGSSYDWSQVVDFGFPVRLLPRERFDSVLVSKGEGYVLVDTPPGVIEIVRSAVEWADLVVVPCGTSSLEVNRTRATLSALGIEDKACVLLTRTRSQTRGYDQVKAYFDEALFSSFDATVPMREEIYQTSGTHVIGNLFTYTDIAREIQELFHG